MLKSEKIPDSAAFEREYLSIALVQPSESSSPVRIIRSVDRGDVFVETVKLISTYDTGKYVDVYGVDGFYTEAGSFILASEGAVSENVGNWVDVPKATFYLAPKQRKEVDVTFSVPHDLVGGTYYGAVIIQESTADEFSGNGAAMRVGGRVGLRVQLTVPEIDYFTLIDVGDLDLWETVDGDLVFGYFIENIGNLEIGETTSTFVLKNLTDGTTVGTHVYVDDEVLLPGERRDMEVELPWNINLLSPADYLVKIEVFDGVNTLEGSIEFRVKPVVTPVTGGLPFFIEIIKVIPPIDVHNLACIWGRVRAKIPDLPPVPFTDTIGHWSEEYVEILYYQGIVEGREPTLFMPNEPITRAELTKIALMSFDYEIPGAATSGFPDVAVGKWYAPIVTAAKRAGIVEGYGDGTFRPGRSINRAEALKVFIKSSGVDRETDVIAPFADVYQEFWYAPFVNFAYGLNIVEGMTMYGMKIFAPDSSITRAEAAKLSILLQNLICIFNERT